MEKLFKAVRRPAKPQPARNKIWLVFLRVLHVKMESMNIDYTVQIWRENNQFIAHAMPLDVTSSGENAETARAALDEAVKLFIKTAEQHGTLAEVLEDAGYRNDGSRWQGPDWICFEKHTAPVAA
jgi:hypothetical protein